MVATAFSRLCTSCKKRFAYKQTDAIFDENGYGYSTKASEALRDLLKSEMEKEKSL